MYYIALPATVIFYFLYTTKTPPQAFIDIEIIEYDDLWDEFFLFA